MKKPLVRCTVQPATTITPTMPAAAKGVSSPSASSTPEPISVKAAARACSQPGRMPMESNHPAVPSRRPPRNTLA